MTYINFLFIVKNLKTRGRFFIRNFTNHITSFSFFFKKNNTFFFKLGEGELVKGKDKKKKQIYLFSDCIVLAEKGTRVNNLHERF